MPHGDKVVPLSLCWAQINRLSATTKQVGIRACIKMKRLFLNWQNELHSCPCQRSSIRAAWPAELIWTVNHRLIHRSRSPEWIIHAHEKLLIFEMFSHWMNQQTNSFLCVSVCVTHASVTVQSNTFEHQHHTSNRSSGHHNFVCMLV